MRPTRKDRALAGFKELRMDTGDVILLPTQVAEERAQQHRQRQDAAAAEQHGDRLRQQQEQVAQAKRERRARAAKDRVRGKALRTAPRPGWHRVLPGLLELQRQLDDKTALGRSADKDVNDRRKRVIERLLERGPDRKVAVPAQWRQACDELESALPHFRQPIRSLRNALALADATGVPPRMAPQLLLGPPGVGKTYFSHRVAELFGSAHASVHFDQPSAGAQLRGSDKYWANSEPGLLFNLIALGDVANPVILLDEIDKSVVGGDRQGLDPLAQLHGALERETAQRIRDVSVDIEFDASLVTYIATANSLRGIGAPIVSRMEVSVIEPPSKGEAVDIARSIAHGALRRLQLESQVQFERGALVVLAHLSPRGMTRAVEQAVAAAVTAGRSRIGEGEVWAELSGGGDPRMH